MTSTAPLNRHRRRARWPKASWSRPTPKAACVRPRNSARRCSPQSGMSAAKFAAVAGIKYSTFAGWLQRYRRAKPKAALRRLRLLEAVVDPSQRTSEKALLLHLPGQVRIELSSLAQVPLVTELSTTESGILNVGLNYSGRRFIGGGSLQFIYDFKNFSDMVVGDWRIRFESNPNRCFSSFRLWRSTRVSICWLSCAASRSTFVMRESKRRSCQSLKRVAKEGAFIERHLLACNRQQRFVIVWSKSHEPRR